MATDALLKIAELQGRMLALEKLHHNEKRRDASDELQAQESRHGRSVMFNLLIAIVGGLVVLLGSIALRYWFNMDV